jgi:hypothetical protein
LSGGAALAKESRELLKKFGIGINDADNGVFLTANKYTARATKSQTAVHSTLPSKAYYKTVYNMLSVAKNEQEARVILRYIKSKLLSGGL